MSVFLEGVFAQFYRGIGPEVQYIAPFARMNFFIGANNAGKSIVLNLLKDHVPSFTRLGKTEAQGVEVYRGKVTGHFTYGIGETTERIFEKFLGRYGDRIRLRERQYGVKPNELLKSFENMSSENCIWFEKSGSGVHLSSAQQQEGVKELLPNYPHIASIVNNTAARGVHPNYALSSISKSICNLKDKDELPQTHLIPAKRILGPKGQSFDDLSGKGLIDHLVTLQNPEGDRQHDRVKFRRINDFLREVTGKPDSLLEVPHTRDHLLVHMDNKVLPLSSLGTGIHEVVLIAAFCTIHDKSIMCIEEPEIHLNPLLQRKLVNYLLKNTESQYFIATHSAAFIDTKGAHVFHVRNDGEQTRVRPAITREGQRDILDDLGYLASDILQANAVIWVEGPSDRIYLNHWISGLDADLVEGIHYTIMFYGGGLISHLSASDDAVESFIRLCELNRNMAIVLDSDRDGPDAALKPHAQRIVDEAEAGGGFVWVTEGREIENYVEGELLQEAMKACHKTIYDAPGETGQYDNAFHFLRKDPEDPEETVIYKRGDKVGAARYISGQTANLDIRDLRARVEELISFIRNASGMQVVEKETPEGG